MIWETLDLRLPRQRQTLLRPDMGKRSQLVQTWTVRYIYRYEFGWRRQESMLSVISMETERVMGLLLTSKVI